MDACTEAESGSVPLPVRLRRASRLSPRVSWAESRYRATESRRASPSSVRTPPDTPRRPSALAMPPRSRTRTDPESSRPSPPATRATLAASTAFARRGFTPLPSAWMTAADPLPRSRRAQPGAAAPGRTRAVSRYAGRLSNGRMSPAIVSCIRSDRPLSSTRAWPAENIPRACVRVMAMGPKCESVRVTRASPSSSIEPGAVKVERGVAGDPVTASRGEPEKSGINGLDGRPPAVERRLLSE